MAVIGDISVSIGADTSRLSSGIDRAVAKVNGMGSALPRMGGMLGPATKGIASMGAGLASMGAMAGTALVGLGPLGLAIGGVVAAVKGVGDIAAQFESIDTIAKQAKALGRTAEDLVGIQHAASLSGVETEQLAMAMNKVTAAGTSIESVADKIAALGDPTERAKVAIKAFGEEGMKLMPLLMEGGSGIRSMMDEGQRLAGFSLIDAAKIEAANDSISRMKLSFTGVARSLAVMVAPAVETVASGFQVFGEIARQSVEFVAPVVEAFGGSLYALASAVWDAWAGVFTRVTEFVGPTFTFLRDSAVAAFVTLEFGITRFGDLALWTWEATKLGAVTMWNDILFGITDRIPAALSWFGDNWKSIFEDIYRATGHIILNLGNNIVSAMTEIWDFIASGGTNAMKFSWTPLLDGFEAATEKLVLPERQLTDLEKQLQSRVFDLSESIAVDFGKFKATRMNELLGPEAASLAPAAMAIEPSEATKEALKGPAVAQRGSKEAFSSIFNAMRGGDKGPMDKVAKTTELQLDVQREQLEEARKANRNSGPQLAIATI